MFSLSNSISWPSEIQRLPLPGRWKQPDVVIGCRRDGLAGATHAYLPSCFPPLWVYDRMRAEGLKMKSFACFDNHYSSFASVCGSETVKVLCLWRLPCCFLPPVHPDLITDSPQQLTYIWFNFVVLHLQEGLLVLQFVLLLLSEKVAGFIPVQAFFSRGAWFKWWLMEDGGMEKPPACWRRTGAAGSPLCYSCPDVTGDPPRGEVGAVWRELTPSEWNSDKNRPENLFFFFFLVQQPDSLECF